MDKILEKYAPDLARFRRQTIAGATKEEQAQEDAKDEEANKHYRIIWEEYAKVKELVGEDEARAFIRSF